MRREGAALMLAASLLAGCGGGDDEPAPPAAASDSTSVAATTSTVVATTDAVAPTTTTVPTLPAIVERRAPTDDERLRLGSERPLACPGAGWIGWDYDDSPIEDDPGGLTSEQALMEMLIELNAEGSLADEGPAAIPMTDWLELVDGDITTFAHPSDDWRILITFATYEPAGVFRRLHAQLCPPDGFVPPTDPPTTPPPTLPPYVETTVNLGEGTLPLPGGYQIAGPVVSALACEQTGRSCAVMEALLTGVLELEGMCLYVSTGDERVSVVWPAGTSWSEEHGMLQHPDGTLVGIGEEVSISGGYADAARVARLLGADELPAILTDCAAAASPEGYWYAATGD